MKRALTLTAALLALTAGLAPSARAAVCNSTQTISVNLQSTINGITQVGPGDCVILLNTGSYTQPIIIPSTITFADNASRLIISSAPSALVNILGANPSGPVVQVDLDSVTLLGLQIKPNATSAVAVKISGSMVKLASSTVTDPSAVINSGSIVQVLGSSDTISNTTISGNTTNTYGLQFQAASKYGTVVQSTITAIATAGQTALEVDGASATVVSSYIEGDGGTAMGIQSTNGTQVLASTIAMTAAAPATNAGLYVSNSYGVKIATLNVVSAATALDVYASSVSVFTNMTLSASGTRVVYVENNAHDDLISQSTITATGGGTRAMELFSASSITVSWSTLYNSGLADAFYAWSAGGNNTISHSSVTTASGGGSYNAVHFQAQGFNTVSDSFLSSSFGAALYFDSSSNNTVAKSTLTSRGTAGGSLNISATANNNTVSLSYMTNDDGSAASIGNSSSFNQILQSTMTSNGNLGGSALYMDGGAAFNRVYGSVISENNAGAQAVYLTQSGSAAHDNVLDSDVISNPSGIAVKLYNGAHHNAFLNSTVTASTGAAFSGAILDWQASSNTFTNLSLTNSGGGPAFYAAQSSSITITGGAFTNNSTQAGGGALVFDNTHQSSVSGLSLNNSVGPALYLYQSSSDTLTSVSAAGGGATAAALFSNAVADSVTGLLVQNNAGGGRGLSVINGGNLNISNSTATSVWSQGLRMDGTNGNTVSASVIRSVQGTAVFLSTSNLNTFTTSVINSISTNTRVGWEDYNGSGNTVTYTVISATSSLQAAVHLFGGTTNDTINFSTLTANNAPGSAAALLTGPASNITVMGSVLTGSSGALLDSTFGNTGNGFSGDVITAFGTGGAALQITNAPANSSTTINNSVISGSAPATIGLAAAGDPTATVYLVNAATLHGTVNVASGGLSIEAGTQVNFLGDVIFSSTAWTNTAAPSTVTFAGSQEVPVRTSQTLLLKSQQTFAAFVTSVASFTAAGTAPFVTTSFTDTVAGSTICFSTFPASQYNLGTLTLAGGTGANGRLNFRSTVPGTVANVYVANAAASTVTLTQISDVNNVGINTYANDGTSIDGGNNSRWIFQPQLDIEAPGEGWTEGVGHTGSAANAVAGVVAVTVRAVSSGHTTVIGSSIPVTLWGSDIHDSTMTQTLVGGTTVFNLPLYRAEPAPYSHMLTAVSTAAYNATPYVYYDFVPVVPGSLAKLEVVLNGETSDPGSQTTGRTGTPAPIVVGQALGLDVRGVDAYWNLVSTISHQVMIATSAANLPQTQSLSGGTTHFSYITFSTTALSRDVVAMDLTNGLVNASTSSVFQVYPPSISSPVVTISIASGSIQTTLGGAIAGTASDPTAVTQVSVALERLAGSPVYFDWTHSPQDATAFSLGAPQYATATLSPANASFTNWSITLPDAALWSNASYYVLVRSSDPSNNSANVAARFIFNPNLGQVGSSADGSGFATVSFETPAGAPSNIGCGPISSSMTFLATKGLGPGGSIAVHIPDSWSSPTGESTGGTNPSATSGQIVVGSTAAYTLRVNPTSTSSGTFGNNWFLYTATNGLPAGTTIYFTYTGFTGGGPQAVGQQTFVVQTQGDPNGLFKPIALQPTALLAPGPASTLQFSNQQFLTLGPLQTSTTMQLQVFDACGNSTNTATATTGFLNAFNGSGAADAGGKFYQAGGAPISSVVVPGGQSVSPGFYFVTSTPGPFYEQIIASATLAANFSWATRYVQVLASTAGITAVSVDTGTFAAGVKVATMTPGSFSGAAVINFTLSSPDLPWEVIISTDGSSFFPELVHRNGYGAPGRSISWYGVTETSWPQTLVKPGGPYYVKIRAGGGVVEDTSLSIYMAPSAFVYGTVNSTGAFAYVNAQGPNTSFANFAVASSTGYFEIYGLQNGGRYNIVAATGSVINGQFVQLQSSSYNVTAVTAGTNIGAIPFPTPTLLRVRVQLPQPAPYEFWGGLNAYSNQGQNAWGTLHFLPGVDKSDDGNQAFGSSASTWTVLGVSPGVYALQVGLQQVGISSSLPNITVNPGQNNDYFLALQRKANVYGWVVVPSSSQYGTWVSVQGTKAGDTQPSVYGGAFLQGYQFGVAQTSAVYSLFGLDPGTWTVTARPQGFASASTQVFISSNVDVGDPVNGGLNLAASSGAVLNGLLQIVGDSRRLPNAQNGGLAVYINAFNPQTYSNGFAQVFIATDAVLARATFTITGLDPGSYFLNTWVQGTQAPQISTNVSSAGGFTTMNMLVDSARAAVTVHLPAFPPPDFTKVGVYYTGPSTSTQIQSFGALPGLIVYATSATWLSPPLSPGYFNFTGSHNSLGANQEVNAQLFNGQTMPVDIDLTGSTFTVSGTVVIGGNINLKINNTAVSVSSVPGVLAQSTTNEYCLSGFPTAISTPTFHLELLPISRYGSYWTNPLANPQTRGVANNCLNPQPNNGAAGGSGGGNNDASPFLAYIINISTDGSFTSPGVPAGTYVMREPTNLSSLSGTGPDELPPVRQIVSVTTSNVSGLAFKITQGITVSGSVRMPTGVSASRGVEVALYDASGAPVRQAFVSFANTNAAPYSLDRVPDGSYALFVDDFGYPKTYGARPVTVKIQGAAISGQDIQLVQTGIIKGKLAIKQVISGSTTAQYLIVDQHNADQLPDSFSLYAEANPWFQGGRTFADNDCMGGCGGGGKPAFDNKGQFSISGVLPGLYDVHFESHNDPLDSSVLKLASSFAPGIAVNSGATTDLGTYNLTAALSLRGTVTDATTGNPVPGVPMAAQASLTQSHEVDRPEAFTDANGNYTLVGLDPSVKLYDIYAGKSENNKARPNYELKVAPSVDVTSVSVQNFAIVPASYSVSGRITGVAGGPALLVPFNGNGTAQLGAVVFIQKNGVQPHDNPIADVMVQTDPQGRFAITALTTGTYKLTAVSLGYGSYSQNVTLATASVTLPSITLPLGATLSGALRKPDGSNPSQREVDTMVAITNSFSQLLIATLTPDDNADTFTNYSIAGFQPGVSYKILIFGRGGTGAAIAPQEGSNVVFSTTTESRSLDVVLRPPSPYVFSKSKKSGGVFKVRFELSQPLRNSRPSDNNLTAILSTFSALGTLQNIDLDASRSILTANYVPGVGESSFTLQLKGFSTQTDPDSLDPVNPQFVYNSTYSFFSGIDGYYANVLSNFHGGTLLVDDDNGRVSIPGGAFQVDASSSISIGLALSNESLAGVPALAAQGLKGSAATIKAMRYGGSAYPAEIFRAVAATPPSVNPLSSFYNILLPLGFRTALQKPVPLTVSYSTSTDPTTLNLYWYNAAANAYVLQQDVTGAKPVIDTVNHTITINVNHFSTFVMFNSNVAVITGNQFSGDFTAYNFPNPFDLSVKQVTSIHGAGVQTVRGTMISIAVPQDVSGDGSIRIFNVAGEKVRTISLGTVAGGSYYYQPWDGRNDSGRDVASGVYIAQVKVGDHSKFFKMALIK